MKKFNRLLSILLVVVMLAGLVTITASAETTVTQTEENRAEHTVTFNPNYDGATSIVIKYAGGTTYNSATEFAQVTAVSREGFHLVNWIRTKTDGTKQVLDPNAAVNSTHEYVAQWELIPSCTVTYVDGGTHTNPVKLTSESGEVRLANASKEGYIFDGWYSDTEKTKKVETISFVNDSNGITIYAKWIQGAYAVKFDKNGGTGDDMENQTFAYESEVALNANTYEKTGHTFAGWNTDKDATLAQYTDKQKVSKLASSGTVTLYAIWNPNEYTIVFEENGGTEVSDATVKYGSKVSKPSSTYDGYAIEGWYTDIALKNKYNFDTVVTNGFTLYAKWVKNPPSDEGNQGATPPSQNPPSSENPAPSTDSVSVSLSALADKKLILKDALPKNYNETFTAYVYVENKAPTFNGRPIVPGFGRPVGNRPSYNPTYGYREYRNLTYKGTVSTSFAVMRKDIGFKYSIFDYFRFPDYRWNSTMTNAFTGTGSIEFTEAGTYTIYIKEQAGKTRYMSYDSDFEKAIVKVTKLDDGTLKAEVTKKAVITNVYDKSANFDADANTSVTLTKVDSVDKTKVLQGAKFKLYQEGKYNDYEYYSTYTTDYSGEIEIFNLAPGDYYFIEVAAPVGYELDDSKIEFTVGKTAKTQDVELTVTNKKINVFTEEHFAYIQGYEDGTVRPQNNITRAEAATILFRLLDDSVRAANWDTSASYADVPAAAWYNNAVATLENMGVLEVGANYRPNENITRAELVNMITKFYDMTGLDIEGVAISDISGHVYETAIKQAAAMGWVKGYTDGSFNPDASITRAEAVTMINRVLERAVEERGMCAGMVTFPDNSSAAWYYEDIQEATNSHTYTRTTTLVTDYDFYYESWGSIQANRDWTALEASLSK